MGSAAVSRAWAAFKAREWRDLAARGCRTGAGDIADVSETILENHPLSLDASAMRYPDDPIIGSPLDESGRVSRTAGEGDGWRASPPFQVAAGMFAMAIEKERFAPARSGAGMDGRRAITPQGMSIAGDVRAGIYLVVRDRRGQYREASDIGRAEHVRADMPLRIAGDPRTDANGRVRSFDLANLPELPKAEFQLLKDRSAATGEMTFEPGRQYSLGHRALPYSIRLEPVARPPSPLICAALEGAAIWSI